MVARARHGSDVGLEFLVDRHHHSRRPGSFCPVRQKFFRHDRVAVRARSTIKNRQRTSTPTVGARAYLDGVAVFAVSPRRENCCEQHRGNDERRTAGRGCRRYSDLGETSAIPTEVTQRIGRLLGHRPDRRSLDQRGKFGRSSRNHLLGFGVALLRGRSEHRQTTSGALLARLSDVMGRLNLDSDFGTNWF